MRCTVKRIKGRAIRRCGELLKQIAPQPGKRTDIQPSAATGTRLKAAVDAGLSKRQQVQALRVASVPQATFEAMVERPKPATVTFSGFTSRRTTALGRLLLQAAGLNPVSRFNDDDSRVAMAGVADSFLHRLHGPPLRFSALLSPSDIGARRQPQITTVTREVMVRHRFMELLVGLIVAFGTMELDPYKETLGHAPIASPRRACRQRDLGWLDTRSNAC
jgi:hypothetical protein